MVIFGLQGPVLFAIMGRKETGGAAMRFPCLVLDHDDTVVQSEMTVNFPYFLQVLADFRPGETVTAEEYAQECYRVGFADFCRQRFHFTEQEILDEYMERLPFQCYINIDFPYYICYILYNTDYIQH